MKRKMKAVLGLAAAVGMMAWGRAWAFNPSDTFTITLTPVGDRGVIITTTTIALGTLSVGTTQYTGGAQGVVVTSTGSIAPLEYTMQASIAGGWSLSTDGYPDTDDELAVQALFNSSAPGLADFEGSGIPVTKHLLTTSAGQVGDAAQKYEGNQELDSLALNISRNLWMQLKLPMVTAIETLQTVTVTVTAEFSN